MNGFGAPQAAEEVKCPKKVKVEVTKVEGSNFSEFAHFSAAFKAEKAEVKSTVAGKVTDVKVTANDIISEDWVIAVIDNALATELKAQEKELAKWKKVLWTRQHWKTRSKKAEAQAQAKIDATAKKIEELKAKAADYTIVSKLAGQVVALNVAKDAAIEAGSVVATIVNQKKLVASVKVCAETKGLFSKGQKIGLESDSAKKAVAEVVNVGDEKVCLVIDNAAKTFKAMEAKFKLFKKEYQNVVVVPKCKVYKDDQGLYVYKASEKVAVKSYIKAGAVDGKKVMVKEGVNIGDHLITAEVLSAKEGTLKEKINCVKDGGKIVAMQKDPESGKYQKVKAGEVRKLTAEEKVVKKEVKKEKVKAKPPKKVVKKRKPKKVETLGEVAARNYFGIGLGLGYVSKSDENFKEIYGDGFSAMFHLSYTIQDKYEAFIDIAYYTGNGVIDILDLETEVVLAPIYLGAKYLFDAGKLKPYLGAAWTVFNIKETNDYRVDSNFSTNHGFSLLAGAYYKLSDQLNLFGDFRYDTGKVTIEGFDEEADLAGIRFHLGLTYNFSK
jgi:multidrug efflux pump subunit AcrA (membrane-fusion protein)/opacity protein-like surface antigen